MWQNILVIIILLCNSVYDLKYKKVPLIFLGVSGLAGVILWLINRPITWLELLMGILVGIAFFIIGKLTKQIGEGDGIILIVLSIYIGIWQLISVLLIALFLSAIFSIVLLVVLKKSKKYTIAFIPFIFISYLIQLVCYF